MGLNLLDPHRINSGPRAACGLLYCSVQPTGAYKKNYNPPPPKKKKKHLHLSRNEILWILIDSAL